MHSDTLAKKDQIIVLNKIDLSDTKEKIDCFVNALPDIEIFTISAATGKGVDQLVKKLATVLYQNRHTEE